MEAISKSVCSMDSKVYKNHKFGYIVIECGRFSIRIVKIAFGNEQISGFTETYLKSARGRKSMSTRGLRLGRL